MKFESPSSRVNLVSRIQAWDIAMAAVCPLLALIQRTPAEFLVAGWPDYALYACIAFVCTLGMYLLFGLGRGLALYASIDEAIDICKVSIGAVALSTAFVFTITRLADIPRSVPPLHLALLAVALAAGRIYRFWRHDLKQRAGIGQASPGANILVYGANRLAWFYIRMLDGPGFAHDRVLAVIDDDPRMRNRLFCGRPILGGIEALPAVLEEYKTHGVNIDHLMIAFDRPVAPSEKLSRIMVEAGVGFTYLPERLNLAVAVPERPDAIPGPAGSTPGQSYWRFKRALDVAAALILGLALAPLLVLVALALVLDVGAPVIFWQRRLGRHGRPFNIYKFRTLRAPFDREGAMVSESRRLSALGALLRRLRIDELPQLWNILRGDMSFIGPRPLLPVDQPRRSMRRLEVPPGITGWAQVHGGRLIDPEEKSALDEWYVDHASFGLDLRIVAMTFASVLFGDRRDESALRNAAGKCEAGAVSSGDRA